MVFRRVSRGPFDVLRQTAVGVGVGLTLSAVTFCAWAEEALVAAARTADHKAAVAALEERADPNQSEADGSTALLWAVHNDDAELVQRLVKAGADVNKQNAYGATAMSEAAVVANPAVLRALLDAGANVESPNADGQTALMVVARSGNAAAAQVLIDRGANVNARETRKGQTALMWATAQSQPAVVKLLVAHGADVEAQSSVTDWERRVTAEPRQKNLASGGFTPLLYAARQGCLECARSIIEAGAQVDRTDPDGVTPLLSALLNAHFDTAKYLLSKGANANKWDWWGRTPLYSAVDFNTVPHGGRPDRVSLDDTTSFAMIGLLLDAGANPNAQLKLFPPYRSLRMDRGADAVLEIGTTPLMRAARGSDLAAMKLLLEHGALVDLPQAAGATPLMVAAGQGASATDTRGKFRTQLDAIGAVQLLLDSGADANAREENGRTALHAAASQGYNDVVKLLVERGADPKVADNDGMTPADAALGKLKGRRGAVHPDTAELLSSRGAASIPADK